MRKLGGTGLAILWLGCGAGCQSRSRPAAPRPAAPAAVSTPAPAPETAPPPAASPGASAPAERPGTMRFLVVHDAEGHPIYVELKQGSGDPALDRRARLYVIEEMRFPPGRTGSVTISIAPDEVPPLPGIPRP